MKSHILFQTEQVFQTFLWIFRSSLGYEEKAGQTERSEPKEQ